MSPAHDAERVVARIIAGLHDADVERQPQAPLTPVSDLPVNFCRRCSVLQGQTKPGAADPSAQALVSNCPTCPYVFPSRPQPPGTGRQRGRKLPLIGNRAPTWPRSFLVAVSPTR